MSKQAKESSVAPTPPKPFLEALRDAVVADLDATETAPLWAQLYLHVASYCVAEAPVETIEAALRRLL
jgi:hypothetical protein